MNSQLAKPSDPGVAELGAGVGERFQMLRQVVMWGPEHRPWV